MRFRAVVVFWSFFMYIANACAPIPDGGVTLFPTASTPIGTGSPATVAPTSGAFQEVCKLAACDFSATGNLCHYTSATGTKQWQITQGRLNNKDTGVEKPAPGKTQYLGVALHPGESAVLSSVPAGFTDGESVVVDFYEATDGIALQGCSNDLKNCQDISNYGIALRDRTWQTGIYKIPPFTSTIHLLAKNSGSNIGAVGIDRINLENDSQGSCEKGGKRLLKLKSRKQHVAEKHV